MVQEIYVFNPQLQIVGICDDYRSIIWTVRYFTAGDFELYLPATEKNVDLFRQERYLCRSQDIADDAEGNIIYHNVMVIQKLQIKTDRESGNFLTITGKSLKSLVGRRIVWKQTTLNGNVEMCIRKLLNENCIEPTDQDRKIEGLVMEGVQEFAETLTTDMQVVGDNLETMLSEICTTYGIGWDIYIKNEQLVFRLYKGVDRSYNQNVIPYVVFCKDYDNLPATEFKYDKSEYKNVALVAGEGEGIDREYKTVGNAKGLERYEGFTEAQNISSNEGEITETEYWKLLDESGQEYIAKNNIKENIEGEVYSEGNYKLGIDYFIGDIVEVINEYGIEATPRIIEIIDSEEQNEKKLIPTFSTWEV